MSKVYNWVITIISVFLSISAPAQIKFEREYRLKEDLVPLNARSFIDSCRFTSKIKWYGEESFTGKSVEAKVKHNGHLYSIEFDTLGQIQDVEIRVALSTIDERPRERIQQNLDSLFSKYKFKEIQVQWTGIRTELITSINSDGPGANITIKYEIVVKGNRKNGMEWFEILFSGDGNIEQVSVITFQNSDNLEY